jgi:pimeloyl-ACP methyl ester carboxylesterase
MRRCTNLSRGRRPGSVAHIELLTYDIAFGEHRITLHDCGPAGSQTVLMVHGLASDASTWLPVQQVLATLGVRSVAMDLLGHGSSDKPRTGYTLEKFSASIGHVRQFLQLPSVTLAGHSFGGALAMYYAHHHPEAVSGLVLVSSGGLGRGVHPLMRALAVPGSGVALKLLLNSATSAVYAHPSLHRLMRLRPELVANLSRTGRNIGPRDGQAAFLATLRHVIKPSGQLGSMMDVGYLDRTRPTLIVWSEHDPIVPVQHAQDLHAYLDASRLELFPGSSHEPHRRFPDRFAAGVLALL